MLNGKQIILQMRDNSLKINWFNNHIPVVDTYCQVNILGELFVVVATTKSFVAGYPANETSHKRNPETRVDKSYFKLSQKLA